MKDLSKLASLTEIPEDLFKRALGIPCALCTATTVEEAREAYEEAPYNSETEEAALKKWIELCTTVEEAREVWERTLIDSAARQAAQEKWIALCTTIGKAKEAYCVASYNSDFESAALKKWIALCTTIEEAREVYECVLPDSTEVRQAALLKIYELFQE